MDTKPAQVHEENNSANWASSTKIPIVPGPEVQIVPREYSTSEQAKHLPLGKYVFEDLEGNTRELNILEEKGTSQAGIYIAEIISPNNLRQPGYDLDPSERVVLKVFRVQYAYGFQHRYNYKHTPELEQEFQAFASSGQLQNYIEFLAKIVDVDRLPMELLWSTVSRPVRQVDVLDYALGLKPSCELFERSIAAGLVDEKFREPFWRNIHATTMMHFLFLYELACVQHLDELTAGVQGVMPRLRYVLRQKSHASDMWSFPFDIIATELPPGSNLEDLFTHKGSVDRGILVQNTAHLEILVNSAMRLANILPRLGFQFVGFHPSSVWAEAEKDHAFRAFSYTDGGALRVFTGDFASRQAITTRLESLISYQQPLSSSAVCPEITVFSRFLSSAGLGLTVRWENELLSWVQILSPKIAGAQSKMVIDRCSTHRWRIFDSSTTTLQWWTITGAVTKAIPVNRCSSVLVSYLRLARSIMESCIRRFGDDTNAWFISSIRIIHTIHESNFHIVPTDQSNELLKKLVQSCQRLSVRDDFDPGVAIARRMVSLSDYDRILAASSQIIESTQLFAEIINLPKSVDSDLLLSLAGQSDQLVADGEGTRLLMDFDRVDLYDSVTPDH